MITYFLNYTGPINKEWLAKHGGHWCGGRIDVHGTEDSEFSVPIMHCEDWSRFGDWLWDFTSEAVLDLDNLVDLYERENPKIRWFKGSL
jgi:hypothetical protein